MRSVDVLNPRHNVLNIHTEHFYISFDACRDWLLIGLSAWIYRNPVTKLNLIGYSISFVAVAIYNQMKIRQQLHNQQKAAMLLGPGGGGSSSRKQTG